MIIRNYIAQIFVIAVLLTSCNNTVGLNSGQKGNDQSVIKADSAQLTTLVRNLYEWHMNNLSDDFPYKFNNPSDSIFTGIDWDTYARNIEVLQKTNFFSKEFFIRHRSIALSIDSSIRQAGIEWRNINDGIPIWNTDADDWCDCQDNPDNYWKFLTLNNFNFSNGTMTFNWTWGNKNGMEANKYEMKARKEAGTWKISYIEGFSYYGTVEHYNKLMTSDEK